MKVSYLVGLAVFAFPGVVFSQQNEGAIRQAEQNVLIRGRINQPVRYSVTGRLTDELRIFNPNGSLFRKLTLAEVRSLPFCETSFQNSGGNWTLRLVVPGDPGFNGARAALWRQGVGVIDSDPFVIR